MINRPAFERFRFWWKYKRPPFKVELWFERVQWWYRLVRRGVGSELAWTLACDQEVVGLSVFSNYVRCDVDGCDDKCTTACEWTWEGGRFAGFYCLEHAAEEGFCWGCGQFVSGSWWKFDFQQTPYCFRCHEEFKCDRGDGDRDEWLDMWEEYPGDLIDGAWDDEPRCEFCGSSFSYTSDEAGCPACMPCGGMYAPGTEECDFCRFSDECAEDYALIMAKLDG